MPTRYISNELKDSVESFLRTPRDAVIPPISFVGALGIGISGFWYPTYTYQIHRASVSASGPGESSAAIYILKNEAYVPRPIVIKQINLGADQTKATADLGDFLITPYDRVYVASFTESLHTGLVVQMVGSMLS